MIKHSEEFKREALRIALTSGLPRERVAKDLGVGKSTLGKWVSDYRPSDLSSAPQADLARENERLRLENRILKDERDILRNPPPSCIFHSDLAANIAPMPIRRSFRLTACGHR